MWRLVGTSGSTMNRSRGCGRTLGRPALRARTAWPDSRLRRDRDTELSPPHLRAPKGSAPVARRGLRSAARGPSGRRDRATGDPAGRGRNCLCVPARALRCRCQRRRRRSRASRACGRRCQPPPDRLRSRGCWFGSGRFVPAADPCRTSRTPLGVLPSPSLQVPPTDVRKSPLFAQFAKLLKTLVTFNTLAMPQRPGSRLCDGFVM